jgi:hypothetical protein
MSAKRLFCWVLAAICSTAVVSRTASAEMRYMQPWMGTWPHAWWAEQYGTPPAESLAEVVRAADVILIGTAVTVRGAEDEKGRTTYSGDIRWGEVIQGKAESLGGPVGALTWEAYTTGIKPGARHLYFLKLRAGDRPLVQKSCYLYDDPKYPMMRLFGATNCDASVGLDVVRFLATGKEVDDLAARLAVEYDRDVGHLGYSAIHMACSLPHRLAAPVLRKAVDPGPGVRGGLRQYAAAVYRMAKTGGVPGFRAILEGLARIPKEQTDRLPESIVFSAVGLYPGPEVVPVVREAVKAHPDWAPSAAFSLARIEGPDARAATAEWRADAVLRARSTRVDQGGFGADRTFGSLFDEAAEAAKAAKK